MPAMKTITCYLDFISPYAYLAFEALPQSLMGVSHHMIYKPVLFGAVLKHHGQLGPAEIAGKREWTYRQVLWQAKQMGVQLEMPASHPFNPLPLLRLAMACSTNGMTNRYVCETIFQHVWHGGAAADDAARLHDLTQRLSPARAVDAAEVKNELKANTEEALACGVFGVPSFSVDGKLFWGLDALPMLRQYLEGDAWFDSRAWTHVDKLPVGITRT
jgi:2-hydroxychromene-2-carboxylate isomerase